MRAVRRAKLFVFLRRYRHELFDEEFQAVLAAAYADSPKGQPPVPPAQLALAVIVQAYTGVSDDEVIEAAVMDRRWQLVLDCLDAAGPPFSKGTLVGFRVRLIARDLDRVLIERTVALAARTRGFGAAALRAALDSSPLRGAGRVEDSINLMGHALRKALGVLAAAAGLGQVAGTVALAARAGVPQLAACSLKAALDTDWDDPAARDAALAQVLGLLDRVEAFVCSRAGQETAQAAVAAACQVHGKDVDQAGPVPVLRRGVAEDRRISIEDDQMRHGRKSKPLLFDGYKRHVLRDLDTGLIPAVGITAANVPEATVTGAIAADLNAAGRHLAELHIDRACLSSALVRGRGPGLAIYCKAWRVRNTAGRYAKDQFTLDFTAGQLTCPAGISMPFQPPARPCTSPRTPARPARCAPGARPARPGGPVAIHPDEALPAELRQRQHTPAGRAKLRERVAVKHTLAHIGHWQGRRARYRGTRKNLFDLRRVAVVRNLHVIARQTSTDDDQLAA
jgi:transposase